MYCPRCGAQNIDGAKFCRGCGTTLDVVALALSDSASVGNTKRRKRGSATQKDWLQSRHDGTKNLMQGVGFVIASALLGIPLALFSHNPDWVIIWLVLVGWVTVWGVVSITSGISDLLESRFMRRQLGDDESMDEGRSTSHIAGISEADTSPNLDLPASVTENTTRLLTKPEP